MNQFVKSYLVTAAVFTSLILMSCVASRVTSVTPASTNMVTGAVTPSTTNTVLVVNQGNLALDCAVLKLMGIPAVTYALSKNPGVRPILVDIQMALRGALHGTDSNIVATITGFVGKDQLLDAELTPLIQAASGLRGQLIAKYGDKAGVQISLAILQTDLDIVTAALEAYPVK